MKNDFDEYKEILAKIEDDINKQLMNIEKVNFDTASNSVWKQLMQKTLNKMVKDESLYSL